MSQALFGIVDNFSDQVKKLFNPSKIQTGNFIFALHQQWTFVIIIVGLIFSSTNNYLNTDAIVCFGGDHDTPYIRDFCFLHGGGHVAKENQGKISSNTQCASMVSKADKDKGQYRTTSYYVWLPFILATIAIITKLPGILWKNVLERKVMEKLVEDMDLDGKKTAERFYKVVKGGKSLQSAVYNFGFAVCEVLNLVAILISLSILNWLFNEEYAFYGFDVQAHRSYVQKSDGVPELKNPGNPMCSLFPTEISCNVSSGAISGGTNLDNILCLLPNNMFYQYYFLILWWWWVILIFITCLTLVYRLVQIVLPQVGRMRLEAIRAALGVDKKCRVETKLQAWDVFLLTRLVGNLKGSQVTKLLEVLDNEEEEMASLLDHEEGNEICQDNEEEEMSSLLDPEEGNEISQEMEMV